MAPYVARHLLERNPDAGGFVLSGDAAIKRDVMSKEPGFVGAKTFAALNPANNK